jgi:hypothetical protein
LAFVGGGGALNLVLLGGTSHCAQRPQSAPIADARFASQLSAQRCGREPRREAVPTLLLKQAYDGANRGTMRAILSAVLLLAATSASADWAKVSETADTVYYIDPALITDKGNLHRVSVIQDYAKQELSGVRSRVVSYEIDCAGERLRSIAVTEHSEPMAQGKSVSSWSRESDWLYVAPRTGSSIAPRTSYRPILRFVCSR